MWYVVAPKRATAQDRMRQAENGPARRVFFEENRREEKVQLSCYTVISIYYYNDIMRKLVL